MSEEAKRYSVFGNDATVEEDSLGSYVRFTDHLALENRVKELEAELLSRRNQFDCRHEQGTLREQPTARFTEGGEQND